MASTIKIKRSASAGNAPNNTNISTAELALNTADRIMYSSDGTDVFEIGANLTSLAVSGQVTLTNIISANGSVGSAGQALFTDGSSKVYWGDASGGSSATRTDYIYTANEGQTTFTGADDDGDTLSLGSTFDVFLNGSLISPSGNYTSNTTAIVFTEAIGNNDIVTVRNIQTIAGELRSTYVYTANEGQTVFTGLDDNSATLSMTNYKDVFVNGILITDTTDNFTANDTHITFTSGVSNNDIVTIKSYDTTAPFTSIDDNGSSTIVTIAANSNVGIGTATPSYLLDVNGALNTTSLYIGGTQVTATAAELNLLDGVTGTLVTEAGTQTLSNKTLTAPKIASGGYIADANGNEQIVFTTTASAVNYFTVTNTATGANQINLLGAAGSDTNIGIGLSTKGTGNVQIGSGLSAGANPSRKLQIQPDSASKAAIGIQAYGTTATEKALIDFFASNGTALTSIGQGAATSELFRLDSVSGYIFATGSGSHAGGTERVRIDSSGNVGINNSSPASRLTIGNNADDTALSGTGNSQGLHIYSRVYGVSQIDSIVGGGNNSGMSLRTYNNGTYTAFIQNLAGNTTTFETAGNERMRIDSSGNVGIGTSSPDADAKLDVNGQVLVRSTGGAVDTTPGGQYGFYIQPDSSGTVNLMSYSSGGSTDIEFYTNSGGAAAVKAMTIDSSGNVGIGNTPSYELDVTGDINASGEVISASDERLKSNIEIISDPVAKINKLNGYTFTRNDKEDKEKRYAGVIAQEVREVLPEVVSENNEGYLSVSYGNIVSLLIEGMKEHHKEIKEQHKEIEDLKALIQQLINGQ
jgi:hypothetical protein